MVCKVSPKVGTPVHRGDEKDEKSNQVADFETALDAAGYGRFSRSALGACSCAFFTTGVQNCVMSYVLTAARAELDIGHSQVGLVHMAFMCGGVASAFFWGIIGDVFGRRNTLVMTLLLDAVLTLAQSTVGDYRWLLAARCLNGFLIGGPSTLVFTHLSDLVGEKKRQIYLTIVGMSFVATWLILPAIAWLIIPIKISYSTLAPIYSWRLFLLLSSIPGFVSGVWLWMLPESPRLLCDTNRSDEALEILTRIYEANHRKGEYKIKKLIQDNCFVAKSMGEEQGSTKVLFLAVLRDLRTLVSKKFAVRSMLILFAFFANMAAGFGLSLWIPTLLQRMKDNECAAKSSLANLTNVTSSTENPPEDVYSDNINEEVYTSSLIAGACCVIGNAACAVLCSRGGAKGVRYAAAACAFACAGACIVLALVTCACASINIATAAAAVVTASSLNGNVLLIRLLLHALPTKLQGLGVCWGAWWGRAGGVASNLALGMLLSMSCQVPIHGVAGLLIVSIGAIMFIKFEESEEDKTDQETSTDKTITLDRYITTHM